MSSPQIVVVGSFVQDLTFNCTEFPRPGETVIGQFLTGPGGKGSNQAGQLHGPGERLRSSERSGAMLSARARGRSRKRKASGGSWRRKRTGPPGRRLFW